MSLDSTRNDFRDLQIMLSKIGKVAGCVKVFDINTVVSDIRNEFFNELKNAKGIWIEFEFLPNVSIFRINEIMDFISKDIDEDCEVIFETVVNDDMAENSVKCKVLFTGLV